MLSMLGAHRDPIAEVVDRLRRIETRFTKYLIDQGFDTQTARPVWKDGQIEIPTPACSLRDILEAVPADHPVEEEIEVYHKGQFILAFTRD